MAQVGNALRVLVSDQDDIESRLRDALTRADPQAGMQAVAPNLEDVFVAATHGIVPVRRRGAGRMNWRRLFAIVVKELRQMRRDRITLAMIVGIPVMQLVLFGYAINLNLRGSGRGHRRPSRAQPDRAPW